MLTYLHNLDTYDFSEITRPQLSQSILSPKNHEGLPDRQLAAELIAIRVLFDVAKIRRAELSTMLGRQIPVQLFTDSKSLFDVISKGPRISEKRMMLDSAAVLEGFKNKTICEIGFVRSSSNVADGQTRHMNQAILREVINSGLLDIQPNQWIARK